MKNFFRIMVLCLFTLASFTLFAGGEQEDGSGDEMASAGKSQITFMTPLEGADGAYMDQIVQGFNEENENVEVTHLVVAEYKQKFSTGVASGTAPETLLIRKFDMPLYMDHFLGFSNADFAQYGINIKDVYPNLLEGLEYNGKIVGIPLDVWIFYMAYNKANFAKAGLDPDNPPMNREDFVAAMEALIPVTPEGITPYYETMTWTWIFSHLLWQFGGDYLTDDFKKPAFVDTGVEVIEFLLDLQERGIIPMGAVDAGPAFESGDASVLITGIWTINPWKDLFGDDFGYAVAPQLGNTNAVFGGSHIVAVTDSMVQKPATKTAAMTWVKYLWDHMIDWYAAGQTPSRKSIAEGNELKEKLPHIWTVAQQAKYVKSFQMFPYIGEIQEEIGVFLEAALFTKEMTPEQAMNEAAASVQYILDDYWAAQ